MGAEDEADIKRGILRRLVQIVIVMLLEGIVLFSSAGTLAWGSGWLLLGVNALSAVIYSVVLLRLDPALIAERGQIKEDVKRWDRPLAGTVSLFGPLAIVLVAGLDRRLGWQPDVGPTGQLVAWAVLAVGYVGWGWAMASNRFFAGLVRIQKERGHTVATGGPYRVVRHPGYASLMLFMVARGLVLGSVWSLIPSGLTAVAAVVRTALEDRTLREELDGYSEYAQQVRYRLLPGIW